MSSSFWARRWIVVDRRQGADKLVHHLVKTKTRNELISLDYFPFRPQIYLRFSRFESEDDFWHKFSRTNDFFHKRDFPTFPTPSMTEHESLWDFYNHIHWDHRKKKFTDDTPDNVQGIATLKRINDIN